MEVAHMPVLVDATLSTLEPKGTAPFMLDGTLGEGGHAEAFLTKYPALSMLGIDADPVILEAARKRLSRFGSRVRFVNAFAEKYLERYPEGEPVPQCMLFDLGISMFHYAKSGRGFAFRADEPLDMRISPDLDRTASDIVNSSGEHELSDLIFKYGEERLSRSIAKAIVAARRISRFNTARRLAEVVSDAVPASYRNGPTHPATRTFQALRIAVNRELERLPTLLKIAIEKLPSGGRIGVITFHSLEDRIVKRFFLAASREISPSPGEPTQPKAKILNIITKKPIVPEEGEVARNPSSRSAKLRVAEKVPEGTES